MPAIVETSMQGAGKRTITETVLNGTTDTLTYKSSQGQILILRNGTAGALAPIIRGAGSTTLPVQGIGSVDVSGGYSVGSIAAGAEVAIPLDTIRAYLVGVVSITGGTGLSASLLEF